MKWTHKSLGFIGLNNTERVVLQALDFPKTVQEICMATKISRTGINYCIKKLIRKGLVKSSRRGSSVLYRCIESAELNNILQTAINEIYSSATEKKGARIRISKENEFVIHIGANEIIPAYERIASDNRNERILAIQHHHSYTELQEKITSKQLADFNRTIIKNHLIIDGMLNESAYQAYKDELLRNPKKYSESVKSLEGRMADYTFFADNVFDYNAELWLFKNTALLINWHEEVAIEITNKSMTAFLRDMFGFVKREGRKVDHNLAMKKIMQ